MAGGGGGIVVVTVRVVVPLTAPDAALIVVVPTATAVANPPEVIVASAVLDDDQVAVLVRFCEVLSLNDPVAMNCCVLPVWIDGALGLIEIETRVGEDVSPPGEELELEPPLHAVSTANRATTES